MALAAVEMPSMMDHYFPQTRSCRHYPSLFPEFVRGCSLSLACVPSGNRRPRKDRISRGIGRAEVEAREAAEEGEAAAGFLLLDPRRCGEREDGRTTAAGAHRQEGDCAVKMDAQE